MAGQDCEPVSFARLMGELKPIDYSQLAGTVVLDEDEWDEWREDLAHAHEREIEIERKCSADAYFRGVNDATDAVFDSATDDLLAEHGLVRLPVDADGVTIRVGDIVSYDGHESYVVKRLDLFDNGKFTAMHDGGCLNASALALCRHVQPADTPASLADELRDWFVEGKSVHIGDKVIRKNGRIGTVIGGAIGKDGKHCLVLSMHDGHWRTYLCPIDEARKLNTGLDFEAEA